MKRMCIMLHDLFYFIKVGYTGYEYITRTCYPGVYSLSVGGGGGGVVGPAVGPPPPLPLPQLSVLHCSTSLNNRLHKAPSHRPTRVL